MSVEVLSIQYAGFPLVNPSPRFREKWPGRRISFFDIPWTCSTWGRGKALIESGDLIDLLRVLLPGTAAQQSKPLSLRIRSDSAPQTVILNGIDMIAATPVETTIDPSVVRRRSTDIRTDLENRVFRQPGIWEIELVDQRYALHRFCTNSKFNVREPSGTCMYPETLFVGNTEYNYNLALQVLWNQLGTGTALPSTTGFPSGVNPEDLIFNDCPTPIAVDRVLNEIGFALYHDASQSEEEDRWSFRAIDDVTDMYNTLDVLQTAEEDGGEGIVLPINSANLYKLRQRTRWTADHVPLIPNKSNPSPASIFKGHRTIEGTLTARQNTISGHHQVIHSNKRASRDTVEPPLDEVTDANTVLTAAKNRSEEMFPLRQRLGGFQSAFLDTGGYTMLTYSWSTDGPWTYVERRPLRPSGQIMQNRLAAQIRGEPHYTGVSHGAGMLGNLDESGWLHLDAIPLWFVGQVTEVYNTTNESATPIAGSDGCSVKPLYGDPATKGLSDKMGDGTTLTVVHAWCFQGSWIEKGDQVLCFYVGHNTRQWVAIGIPPVVTDRYCPPDPESCIFSGTTECNACSPVGDKAQEITTGIPAIPGCVGSVT